MRIGQTSIDFEANQINGPAGNYSIEPLVMQVLSVLVENADQVISRDDLIDKVWGVGYGGDERLSRAISLLRKSLGDVRGKHELIQTIPKTGYMFTPKIEPSEQENKSVPSEIDAAKTARTPAKKKTKSTLVIAVSAVFIALAAFIYFGKNAISPSSIPEPPLVIIMDSAHPKRVYDDDIRTAGGTNADILSDILADLPLRTQKELISPSWHRYESILQFEPELIVIHYSGFKQEDSSGDRPQLRLLIKYFLKTETKFLIYSRAGNAWLDGNMNIVMEELYAQNPELRTRIDIFPIMEYGKPEWKDQATAQALKLKIKDMLQLE